MTLKLQTALDLQGFTSQSWINTKNLFDETGSVLTAKMARESVLREIHLESEWFRFLQRDSYLQHWLRMTGRKGRYFLDWKRNSESLELRRLLNIEFSHVDLYRRAIESGAKWAIILEDDASARDVKDLVSGLTILCEAESPAKMINISESFPLDLLGIRHLLNSGNTVDWEGTSNRSVLISARPATNTVCAIAFRTDFLAEILADFDSQQPQPIVPIDWKLNAAIMRLWDAKKIGPNECWFVEPAPIIQLSMVRDREGK